MFEFIQINQQGIMALIHDAEDVDGRIILRWIFRKLDGVVGTGWSWLRIGTGSEYLGAR
jgi:hypothetical protein